MTTVARQTEQEAGLIELQLETFRLFSQGE